MTAIQMFSAWGVLWRGFMEAKASLYARLFAEVLWALQIKFERKLPLGWGLKGAFLPLNVSGGAETGSAAT